MPKDNIILVTLSPKTHRTSEENLGLAYLKSSLLERGYNVKIIDGWLNELSVEEVYNEIINDNMPLFIGFSSYMSNTLPTIELVSKLKQYNANYKIICGGFGPTFYPTDYLKNGTDFVIRGEGEKAICDLADCLYFHQSIANIKSLSYKNNDQIIHNPMDCLIENLDSIPFPSRDTMENVLAKKSTVNMLTARGCSGNCEFCSVISFFRLSDGRVWRTRSITNIVDEIEQLYNMGVTYIKIVDDSFIDGIRDGKWCKDFADEIERRNIKVKLRGQIRADKITDAILFDLKRAGFFSFACGIENGSETALKRMNKKATVEDNRKALNLFKKYNYLVQMGYILFDKDTTLEELEENYLFLSEFDFAVTKGIFSEMYSAEGTKLNGKLKNSGELKESNFIDNNNKYSLSDIKMNKMYEALKLWHKSHSEIYDMTIDPLSSPKAIDEESRNEFYAYVMDLKKRDLEIFRSLILMIKNNEQVDLLSYTTDIINQTSVFYDDISNHVKKLYHKNDLVYNADKNPFI